jgi:IS5 family transposase
LPEEFMSYVRQGRLFTFEDFFVEGDDNHRLVMVLEALDDDMLIRKLESRRKGRRDHYPIRMLWQSLIAGKVYGISTVNGLIRELMRNGSLRRLLGIERMGDVPKPWQYSRFVGRLSKPENLAMVQEVLDRAVDSLREILPDLGESIAVDGTGIRSWCNRFAKELSDADAGWGIRRRSNDDGSERIEKWYGYKLELAVDTKYEIPLGFEVVPANTNECRRLPIVLGNVKSRHPWLDVRNVIADKGYDSGNNCRFILYELKALPIIPMRLTQDKDKPFAAEICHCTELGTPICDCGGKMTYAGRDGKYLKFRCPQHKELRGGPCSDSTYGRVLKIAISENERRWPGLWRESKKFARLYRRRSAVERVNSRLKEHLCLDEQHVRGLGKTTVNVSLSLLVMVGGALAMARGRKLEKLRQVVAMAA